MRADRQPTSRRRGGNTRFGPSGLRNLTQAPNAFEARDYDFRPIKSKDFAVIWAVGLQKVSVADRMALPNFVHEFFVTGLRLFQS